MLPLCAGVRARERGEGVHEKRGRKIAVASRALGPPAKGSRVVAGARMLLYTYIYTESSRTKSIRRGHRSNGQQFAN